MRKDESYREASFSVTLSYQVFIFNFFCLTSFTNVQAWRENFIEEFKNNHGYEPKKSDIDYYENEEFPRNYNLSLDADLVNSDKSAIENMVVKNTEFEWSDEILTAFEILTNNEKLVIEKIYLENMKKIDIAAEMGISNAMVTKYHKKALEKLRMKI